MNGRVIIVGDLHGCYEEAVDLLDRVGACAADRVIFAGDLVDRGPKPRASVELAMQHEAVLGNHEEKHLREEPCPDGRLSPDHLATRRALGPEHFAFFRRLPRFLRLPEFGAAIVHAGAFPDVALEAQDPYHLLHAQCIRPPSKKSFWPSKAPSSHTFWTNHWRGPERLIFGHTVLDRPLVTDFAVGIDTGCVFGGALTAVVLPGWEIVSVPSRQPPSARRRSADFTVHGEVRAYS